jgi:hypothetical protein
MVLWKSFLFFPRSSCPLPERPFFSYFSSSSSTCLLFSCLLKCPECLIPLQNTQAVNMACTRSRDTRRRRRVRKFLSEIQVNFSKEMEESTYISWTSCLAWHLESALFEFRPKCYNSCSFLKKDLSNCYSTLSSERFSYGNLINYIQ